MNGKQVLGLITFATIVGGTAYCIYLSKKEKKEEWTVADAKAEVQRAKEAGIIDDDTVYKEAVKNYTHPDDVLLDDERFEAIEMEQMLDEARDEASWNASFNNYKPGIDYKKEENVLRYEPNSKEALEQFIDMELSEYYQQDHSRKVLYELFSFKLEPQNEGDKRTFGQISDYRADFFGPTSKWNIEITMADVILHYARLTDYNVGHGIRHWLDHILDMSGLTDAENAREMRDIVAQIHDHKFYNHAMDTYTLFGIDLGQSHEVRRMADGDIEGLVTYDMEFNVFVEGCI